MEGVVPQDCGDGFEDRRVEKIYFENYLVKKNRDGGNWTPGYGSEDRRVAITPHPYILVVSHQSSVDSCLFCRPPTRDCRLFNHYFYYPIFQSFQYFVLSFVWDFWICFDEFNQFFFYIQNIVIFTNFQSFFNRFIESWKTLQ